MLVLTRKLDEKIQIGQDVTITIVRLQGNAVRIGIDAPRGVHVRRGELPPTETVENDKMRDWPTRTLAKKSPSEPRVIGISTSRGECVTADAKRLRAIVERRRPR